eukprot:CAMPEP_0172418076 /NCGR_PEP_ID=MMETSP1064-20121228/4596_1 /TAXON_ID=202472 /ORGANISM="Aulacoseira subarctica , Strain CCAP 1002/5" /LENGTH=283 /DNA_ID=CAMNT_0013156797 /DNA_START=158 /DNA_END=1009 /DNA_ORIENTATION=+
MLFILFGVTFLNFNSLTSFSRPADSPQQDSIDHITLLQQQTKGKERKQKGSITGESLKASPDSPICDVMTIEDAIELVRKKKHIVQPPPSPITLVCCKTTKGPLSIAVHPNWAPHGADRFLSMVQTWYFSSKVPLFRCLKNFICQFGIAGDPTLNKPYNGNLPDDPNWLPEGPEGRERDGKFRYSKGYLAYAGAGKNSRSNQLIVALGEDKFLGGGSPWEVPFGEVIGDLSMKTLDTLYTGYGEKGPTQSRVYKEGASAEIAKEFQNLDYVLSCDVVGESSSW